VDLWQFYESVEKLITDLRSAGHAEESDEVEIAIRGGATSGEVLGRLSVTLPTVARRVPQFEETGGDLASWATKALKS
jgi:hypothetical protein